MYSKVFTLRFNTLYKTKPRECGEEMLGIRWIE